MISTNFSFHRRGISRRVGRYSVGAIENEEDSETPEQRKESWSRNKRQKEKELALHFWRRERASGSWSFSNNTSSLSTSATMSRYLQHTEHHQYHSRIEDISLFELKREEGQCVEKRKRKERIEPWVPCRPRILQSRWKRHQTAWSLARGPPDHWQKRRPQEPPRTAALPSMSSSHQHKHKKEKKEKNKSQSNKKKKKERKERKRVYSSSLAWTSPRIFLIFQLTSWEYS